ncbi:methyltransferase domain-containing protein [Candidatus Poribacteria bacterium]|nr:methyltransferase domain-containing protein [Candidatus Poribacteria bacterium]
MEMPVIGCDACELPLPDSSLDAMALHCSFEHFEGDSDTRFVREAMRVLRPGGGLLIIPFYCGEQGVEVFKPDFAPGCQFHRYYDPGTFRERVLDKLGTPVALEVRLYPNVRQVDSSFYCDYSILLRKSRRKT